MSVLVERSVLQTLIRSAEAYSGMVGAADPQAMQALATARRLLDETVTIGDPIEIPTFDECTDFTERMHAERQWYDQFVQGRKMLRFPVADGFAEYVVDDDYTIRHLPAFDAYRVPNSQLAALTRQQVDRLLAFSA